MGIDRKIKDQMVLLREVGEIKEGVVDQIPALEKEQAANRDKMCALISEGQTHSSEGVEVRGRLVSVRRELEDRNRRIKQVHDYARALLGADCPRTTVNMFLRFGYKRGR